MFTATGFLHGEPRTLTWDNGIVRGDPDAVVRLYSLAREAQELREPIGPQGGPYITIEHLTNPVTAGILIARTLDSGDIEWTGDLPAPLSVPPDAVI